MTFRLLILIITLAIIHTASFAQIRISGTVKDSKDNTAIEFANISLLNQDSVFIKGTSTDQSGKFLFENITPAQYIVSVSNLGYENSFVALNNSDKNFDMGEITITPSSILLNDVTITANAVIRKSDRQIILPTQSQLEISNNGLSLLKNLQLPRIIINPISNTITVPGGESVQLRINGVEVTQSEIVALNPADIVRIEYHDDPGMRYNNAAAVLDYITRQKESGGNISTDLGNTLSDIGWAENYFSAKYNHRKSEFSTTAYWGRRDIEWIRENYETFIFPDHTLNRIEEGEPTKVKYDNLNLSLNYNLQEADKYLLNVRVRNKLNDTPNEFENRTSSLKVSGSDIPLSIIDSSSSWVNSPSLDIYFQKNLKKDQLLIFNMVGTYMNSKNDRLYQESREDEISTDIYSHIKGNKYSLIGEGIYEKKLKKGQISSGIKHIQTYTDNKYSGNVDAIISMNTAETYLYAEYQLKHKKFNYMLGLGGMRTYNSQNGESNEKFIFRPRLRVTYNINDNLFFRYNGYITGYPPSLSNLNNVEQSIDSFQVRRGNPGLKTVIFYSNTINGGWNKGIFGIDLYASYNYSHQAIMEDIFFEDGKFIRMHNNQKGFHRIYIEPTVKLRPFKDYVSLSVSSWMGRYISQGNLYTHTYNNWGMRGNLSLSYKRWYLSADVYSRYNNLWGENLNRGERFHMIVAGYNADHWSLGAGFMNPFEKHYSLESRSLSALAPNRAITYADDLNKIFLLKFSLNLNFGRQYSAGKKRLNNEDTDTGVMSGKK